MATELQRPGRGHGRVLEVLEALGEARGGLTLNELTERLTAPKSSVWLIVQHFVDLGFAVLEPHTRAYRVGPRFERLAMRVSSSSRGLAGTLRPHLERLCKSTTEDVYLGALSGTELTYIDKVEGTQSVRLDIGVGVPRPLHCTAAGRVLLAFGAADLVDEVLAQPLEAATSDTVAEAGELRRILAIAREQGYATSDGQAIEGVAAVAAPVLGPGGAIVAAISISGPRRRIAAQLELLIQELSATRAEAEASLRLETS